MARKERRGARGQLAQIRIGVLLFVTIALDAHRDAGRVALRGGLEHLEQIAIGIHALWLRAHVLFKRWQHPLFQTRHMNIQPIVIPVEGFGIPRQELRLILGDAGEECAHIVRAKDVSILYGERQKHLEGFFGLACLLFDAIDRLLHTINHAFVTAAAPAWFCFIQERSDFLRGVIHHRQRSRIEPFGRNSEGLKAG